VKNLTIRRTIEASMTADQWGLFPDEISGARKGSASRAARALNKALEKAVNGSQNANQIYQGMRATQAKYADLGAQDSEPEGLIDRVVDTIYDDGGAD